MRKEQIWFSNKGKDSAELFSLADSTARDGVRETENVYGRYTKGAFKGIPNPQLINSLMDMENIPSVSVPATCTNITTIAKLVSLKTLILTKTTTEITKIAKDSLALLNADINIKVPSSLVDDYKADAVWGARANYITAID